MLCTENEVEDSRLDKTRIQALAPAARSEFCLSSAIVGGIAAQEIIKFVTGRGKPMENQFYFDAMDSKCENDLLVASRLWLRVVHPLADQPLFSLSSAQRCGGRVSVLIEFACGSLLLCVPVHRPGHHPPQRATTCW